MILISTGQRSKVFKDTFIFNTLSKKDKIFVVTDESNLDIYKFDNRNVELAPMNPETFLIFENEEFESLIDFSRTKLSKAFARKLIKNPETFDVTEYFQNKNNFLHSTYGSYYFEPLRKKIKWIHSSLKRGNQALIGINIGEDEHATKKLPISSIVELISKLRIKRGCKFVLFGTGKNNLIREDMILRQTSSFKNEVVTMVGLTDIKYLAQAISLCDLFISSNTFGLHLSTAIGQKTIGIMARVDDSESQISENFHNLIKIKNRDNNCTECNDEDECEMIEKSVGTCFNGVSIEQVAKMANVYLNEPIKETKCQEAL